MFRIIAALVIGSVSALFLFVAAVGVSSVEAPMCPSGGQAREVETADAPLELARFGAATAYFEDGKGRVAQPLVELPTGEFRPPANLRERLLAERQSRSTRESTAGSADEAPAGKVACDDQPEL